MRDMRSPRKKKAPRKSFWRSRFFVLTLVVFCLISLLVPVAQAAWDGSGSTPGNTDANPAVGNFWIDNADSRDIYGYRFSVYDGNGHTTKHLA